MREGSFQDAPRLFYSSAEVKPYNGDMLRVLETLVLKVKAKHFPRSARKAMGKQSNACSEMSSSRNIHAHKQ